jgi:hypothetical protein
MNERIGKLVEQAEEWVCKNYPDAMDDNDEFHAQTMYKFAELIISECADIGERYADGNYEVRNQIMAQFGLEEPEE